MRRYLAVFLLLSGLALTACGGSSNKTATGSQNVVKSTTTTAADRSSGSDSGSDSSGSGDIDCAEIKADAATFLVQIQLLAQFRNKDAYDLVKSGTVTYDPAKMATILTDFESLEGVDLSPLQPDGAVKKAIDNYSSANDLAKQNLAVDDPFTQAKGQELADMTKDIAGFLSGQTAIDEAISKACP